MYQCSSRFYFIYSCVSDCREERSLGLHRRRRTIPRLPYIDAQDSVWTSPGTRKVRDITEIVPRARARGLRYVKIDALGDTNVVLLSLWYLRQAWLLSSASKYHNVMAYLVLYAGWTSWGFLLSDQKNKILSKQGSMSATWSRQPSGNILSRPPFFCKIKTKASDSRSRGTIKFKSILIKYIINLTVIKICDKPLGSQIHLTLANKYFDISPPLWKRC